jgi:nitric oxide reductase NorF protein
MSANSLVRAWGWLLAMSAATTILTLASGSMPRGAFAGAVLLLAGLKARLILTQYLGLSVSRFWRGSFALAIGLFLLAAFALTLAGNGGWR